MEWEKVEEKKRRESGDKMEWGDGGGRRVKVGRRKVEDCEEGKLKEVLRKNGVGKRRVRGGMGKKSGTCTVSLVVTRLSLTYKYQCQ